MDDDIPLLESFLLEAVVVSPIATDRICQLLINVNYKTKKVSKRRVLSRCLTLCERALAQGNMFEAIWLLYTLRGLDLSVSSKLIGDAVEHHEGSCFPLILLDMQSKGKFITRLPTTYWESLATQERIERDWIWLLAYEGIRHGWLQDRHNIMVERFFSPMKARNIAFYDPRRNVQPTSKTRSKRLAGLLMSLRSSKELLAKLRGEPFSSY